MDARNYIFEERWFEVKQGAFREFKTELDEQVRPAIASAGGSVVYILSAQIGEPLGSGVMMTRYPDLTTLKDAQKAFAGRNPDLVTSESIRPMRSITASRPRNPVTKEDHRAIFGHRRFFTTPKDLEECARLSEDRVWPRFYAHDCSILGLFTPLAVTHSQEVLLVAGYNSLAHWEETRPGMPMPEAFDKHIWDDGHEAVIERSKLVHRSWLTVLRPIYLEGMD